MGLDDMVDTGYDGITDMTFKDALKTAEDRILDPNSSNDDLEGAKSICDSINNMLTCEED